YTHIYYKHFDFRKSGNCIILTEVTILFYLCDDIIQLIGSAYACRLTDGIIVESPISGVNLT
ncbi:hypothetical protein, partial [Staphylococcus saprophyticus]|uniref:hypothetical protein n=1 Tax=Staphylococcus saprophyticus TaxID=29385 RepID=UPI001CD9C267